jgi:hypothetical protein
MVRQGDIALLNDPLLEACLRLQCLPSSHISGQMRRAGVARLVSLGCPTTSTWHTPRDAPKVKALVSNPRVALTINTYKFPYIVPVYARPRVCGRHHEIILSTS